MNEKINYLSIFLLILLFISVTSCSKNTTQTDPSEEAVELDHRLSGKWEAIDGPATLEFTQLSPTKGEGIRTTDDVNGWCEGYPMDVLTRTNFEWTQTD